VHPDRPRVKINGNRFNAISREFRYRAAGIAAGMLSRSERDGNLKGVLKWDLRDMIYSGREQN